MKTDWQDKAIFAATLAITLGWILGVCWGWW